MRIYNQKKTWCKFLSLMLSAILIINLLSGCGQRNLEREEHEEIQTRKVQEERVQLATQILDAQTLSEELYEEIKRGQTEHAKETAKTLNRQLQKNEEQARQWLEMNEYIQEGLSYQAERILKKRKNEYEKKLTESKTEVAERIEKLINALNKGEEEEAFKYAGQLKKLLTPNKVKTYGIDREQNGDERIPSPMWEADSELCAGVAEKAEELATPLNIYNYLKNNINYEFYYGSRKGASGTFNSLGGNDMDQASLLIAMLRHLGYESEYVCGEVEITAEQALSLTGADTLQIAAQIMASGGTKITAVLADGEISTIRMEHVWVRTYVPYSDYRGAGNAAGEMLAIDLDTGIKKYKKVKSICDFLDKESVQKELCNTPSSLTENEVGERIKMWVQQFREQADAEVYLTRRIIEKKQETYLPLSLQYNVIKENKTFWSPSEQDSDRVELMMAGESLGTYFSWELAEKEVLLSFRPADETEEEIYRCYASVFDIPSYAIRMKPILLVDGEVKAEGSSALYATLGEQVDFSIMLHSCKKTSIIKNDVTYGSMYAITLNTQNITSAELKVASEAVAVLAEAATEENLYTEECLGKLLALAGKQYFAQVDIADAIARSMYDVHAGRSLSEGISGYEVKKISLYGQLVGISAGSLFIDVDTNKHYVVSLRGEKETEREYMLVTGMVSSLFESVVWEQLTGMESVSTMSILGKAQEEDIEVLAISNRNLTESLGNLMAEEALKEEITAEVNSGKIIIIPQKEITINEWIGTGYMIIDPETGAGAYKISGGLNGGATTFNITMDMLTGVFFGVTIVVELVVVIVMLAEAIAGTTLLIAGLSAIAMALGIVALLLAAHLMYQLIDAYIEYVRVGTSEAAKNVEDVVQTYEDGVATLCFLEIFLSYSFRKSNTNGGGTNGSGSDNTGSSSVVSGDYSQSSIKLKIIDGKVNGQIPVDEYLEIRARSLKNETSSKMTLGKYLKNNQTGEPLPEAYTEMAKKYGDSYFDLGEEWDEIIQKYGISNADMFELFNKPALDYAVESGKTIRFSQNPELPTYEGTALADEWRYLQTGHGYIDLKLEGEFWYAIK